MGQRQLCAGVHDGEAPGTPAPAQSFLTPACLVCRGMIIPGDRTVVCQGGCQHIARLHSAGVARSPSGDGWKVVGHGNAGLVYRTARAAVEASKLAKRHGVVYNYTSKVHRGCMSRQRIRVARLGPGKRTLCKDCVAYHNFNAGRSPTSRRLSAYCMDRAQLELEIERAQKGQSWGEDIVVQRDTLTVQDRVPSPPLSESDASENQSDVCDHIIISQVQEKREARNRRRHSLEAAQSLKISELKRACQGAVSADARACSCEDDSRVHFLRQEAKYAYLLVNQLMLDVVEATETLRRHLAEQTQDYCYDPREKKDDMASLRALEEKIVRLRELKVQYDARTDFFQTK